MGYCFAVWPLHVTVMPWFRHRDDSALLAAGLGRAFSAVPPFEAEMLGQAMFGPRKNRLVRLVKAPTNFTLLEQRARAYLHKKHACLVDETTKVRPEYCPHVTEQGDLYLRDGDTFRCDRLYIVEQKGQYKVVMNEIVLHD